MIRAKFKDLLKDVAVEVSEEFDRNFERKAFFDQAWPGTRLENRRGSLMMRTGNLRRSIRHMLAGYEIIFTSSAIYAALMNEGGEVKVTPRMKKFFWAMYYKTSGAVTYNTRSRGVAKTKRNTRLQAEAENWKALALKKVGDTLKFPARRFIGQHQQVDEAVQRASDAFMQEVDEQIKQILRKNANSH